MATCTTRTLEGMYIFSNPPKPVAAPISLKQAGKLPSYKNYRNTTVANNYRSIYSPNHFISGRPLSGYWWREKKETYEQQVNSLPQTSPKFSEEKKTDTLVIGNKSEDVGCQTSISSHYLCHDKEVGTEKALVHSYCQTVASDIKLSDANVHGKEEIPVLVPSQHELLSQQLLAQAEEAAQEDSFSLEIVSRILSHSYVENMIPNLCEKFKECNYDCHLDRPGHESESVLPWLMNELELGLSRLEASYELLNQKATR